jgi:hypothetical protein
MAIALRCLAIAVLGLCLLPAAALGDKSVSMDPDFHILTVHQLNPDTDDDRITVRQTVTNTIVSATSVSLSGEGICDVTGPTNEVSCPLATSIAIDLGEGNDRLRTIDVTVPVSATGGAGSDDLEGGAGNDVLAGGPGGDTLNGLGGVDDYFGEAGNDIIEATDGRAERISCGADTDAVHNDFIDIIAECETGIDGDRDNFSSAVDCNDANPSIFPGAKETFSNGIDEDCNGRDDVNLDVDGDGFARPADCNDNDPKVRPNAREIRGNTVDENCDRVASPWMRLPAVVSNRWAVGPNFTLLRGLILHNLPRGARIVFSCNGSSCPFRKTRRRTVRSSRPITLSRGLTSKRLRAGTRFRLTITAAETIGRTYTYTIRNGALPSDRTTCRAPDERRGEPC